MLLFQINFWAILLCVVIYNAIGGAWYSPLLFGKAWGKLKGFKDGENKIPVAGLISSAIGSLFVTLFLAIFISKIKADTWFTGTSIGILFGVSLLIVNINNVFYTPKENFKNALELFWVDNLYNLLAYSIIATVLTIWK